jgi:16S rRNA (uracil1498-N3)-methyltransferase
MRRYWLPANSIQNDVVVIEGDPFHHIFDVCRQERGSKFEVLGVPGQAHLVEVTELGKKKATARVLSTRKVPPLPKPHLVLALSISRYQVMDSVVERAVEMGVAEIRPFFSDFSFVRKATSLPDSKLDRWRKIVVSATQQSGRGDLMPVKDPVDFEELLQEFNRRPQAAGLFAYEGASPKAIRELVQDLPTQAEEVWIFVGSEGGFSVQEVQKIQDLGLVPVTLGDQVLRVETACIALVSILKYELGLMASSTGEK